MNEILWAVFHGSFRRQGRSVWQGSKVRPVVFNRADHKPETHCQTVKQPANAVTLSLATVNCSCCKGQRFVRATLKIPFEHSSSLRVAPKSWSISSGARQTSPHAQSVSVGRRVWRENLP